MTDKLLKMAEDGNSLAMGLLFMLLAVDKAWMLTRRFTGTSLEKMDKKIGRIDATTAKTEQRQRETCIDGQRQLLEEIREQGRTYIELANRTHDVLNRLSGFMDAQNRGGGA